MCFHPGLHTSVEGADPGGVWYVTQQSKSRWLGRGGSPNMLPAARTSPGVSRPPDIWGVLPSCVCSAPPCLEFSGRALCIFTPPLWFGPATLLPNNWMKINIPWRYLRRSMPTFPNDWVHKYDRPTRTHDDPLEKTTTWSPQLANASTTNDVANWAPPKLHSVRPQ